MRQTLKALSQVLFATAALFFILEVSFRLAGEPTGATRFAERIIIREHLSVKKAKGEFRIFTFGESTMHGSHYAPVSSPAQWLEKYLKDFLPGRNIRVINFARMGRGSHFTYETFKETLVYQPDLVIVYTGHNAFLPRNRWSDVKKEQRTLRHFLRSWQKRSVFFSACYRWVIRKRMEWHQDKPEDQMAYPVIETAPLGYGGDVITPRNSKVYRENIELFKENMRSFARLAKEKKISTLFLRPVSNLKDFAPYYSVHLKELSPGDLSHWQEFYEEGKRKQGQGNFRGAEADYLQAAKIDDTPADLLFRLGQIYFKKGKFGEAEKFFEGARDNDAIVFRAPRDILAVFEELGRTENLPWVDTEEWLRDKMPGGILGEPLIEDNVHFSLEGHALVARHLADELARRNWIAPHSEWQFERERSYEEIARELGVDEELLFSADLKMVHYFGSRFENRVRFAKKALKIHPEDPRALRHLAWTYWLMGERAKALEVYRQLRSVSPQSFDEIFSSLEDLEKASQNYDASRLLEGLDRFGKGAFVRPK